MFEPRDGISDEFEVRSANSTFPADSKRMSRVNFDISFSLADLSVESIQDSKQQESRTDKGHPGHFSSFDFRSRLGIIDPPDFGI